MFLQSTRKIVTFPDLQENVEMRTLQSRDMLETGLYPIILKKQEGMTPKEDAKQLLEKAGEVCCQCSVFPKIVREEVPRDQANKGRIALADLTDVDRLYGLDEVVTLSIGRFYGSNRTAFDPAKFEALIQAQERICFEIDSICQRYGLSPLEVFRWRNDEMADVLALMDGSDGYQERIKIQEENKNNG